jgi:hypothetical protein
VSPRRIDAPETAALMAEAAAVAYPLTSDEAAAFERDLAKIARRYGRAREMVKNLKRQLGRWEREMKNARREMRTLISVRRK